MNLLRLTKSIVPLAALLLALLCVPAAQAQEEAEEDEGSWLGSWYMEVETWIAQAAGLGYSPATELDPNDPFGTTRISPSHGTETEFRYTVRYELPKHVGDIVVTYFTHEEGLDLERLTPGEFVYGETMTNPLFAGFGNDGLADGFTYDAETNLRDLRIELHRPAFRSSKLSGDWFIGWRRVVHKRSQDVAYHALAPDLPPLIPPDIDCGVTCPNFDPFPDTASVGSRFEGRGATVGIDLEFKLWKDKLIAEGGVALTVMRGKTDTDFSASNSYYFLETACTSAFLGPPYDEFTGKFDCDLGGGLQNNIDFISQETANFGVKSESTSSTSQVLDTYIGFRFKVRRWIEVFGGFRNTRYTDVGIDIKQTTFSQSPSDDPSIFNPNLQTLVETDRSATYEGFYGGISFRLY